MTWHSDMIRELYFLLRQRFAVGLLAACGALCAIALWAGLADVAAQRATIDRLLKADRAEREAVLAEQSDFGGAAYYSFHLTYDPPSQLAFAALGVRDEFPWKQRIRMLAIEGQIYETDVANPELSLSGRFDYAFVVSILLPLFVILLLFDLRASERTAGRENLLLATARSPTSLWRVRMFVRCLSLWLVVLIPFWILGSLAGAPLAGLALSSVVVTGHLVFWAVVGLWAAHRPLPAATIATGLLGFWLLTAFVIPLSAEQAVKAAIASPEGGEIIMTQREAVNDAWDLPKQATMDAFLARYPQWTDDAEITAPFEWKWYYAFQQVGDMIAAPLSQAYRDSLTKRDRAQGWLAVLSPPALTQRLLTSVAGTGVADAQAYERDVRDFHRRLRAFYYPLLFKDPPFDPALLEDMPTFDPAPTFDPTDESMGRN